MATAIIGAQFGDEGKGRVADNCLIKERYDINARFGGGPNAGHTLVFDGKTHKVHQVPSSIVHRDVLSIIGNGGVVEPIGLLKELDGLRASGFEAANFMVSSCAHIIMPWHPLLDLVAETKRGANSIGTTGKGIGPCYSEKASRDGIRMGDLFDGSLTNGRIRDIARDRLGALRTSLYYRGVVPTVQDVMDNLSRAAERLERYVADTDFVMQMANEAGMNILLEGAQGTMLDLDSGTYPNVSSSYTTAAGACIGTGLPPSALKQVLIILKAYITRVGSGPLPTELHGPEGVKMQQAGHEVGTTTGRIRRCGWFDLPVARHARRINGATGIFLTKLDVLSYLSEIKICTDYELPDDCRSRRVPDQLAVAKPKYVTLPGWEKPIDGITSWEALPDNARRYVDEIEALCGLPVVALTTGPERDSIIWR